MAFCLHLKIHNHQNYHHKWSNLTSKKQRNKTLLPKKKRIKINQFNNLHHADYTTVSIAINIITLELLIILILIQIKQTKRKTNNLLNNYKITKEKRIKPREANYLMNKLEIYQQKKLLATLRMRAKIKRIQTTKLRKMALTKMFHKIYLIKSIVFYLRARTYNQWEKRQKNISHKKEM